METIVLVLLIIATMAFGIQLSFIPKVVVALWLLIIGTFTWVVYPFAIEQSYDLIRGNLQNNALMIDFVVLLVIDAVLGALLAIYMIRSHYGEKVKKVFKYSIFFPGLIVFLAIFYFESLIYLNVTGVDFNTMAIVLAIVFAVVIGSMQLLIRVIIPEFELRVEIKFIVHLLQMIGAVVLSVHYMGLPVEKAPSAQFYSLEYGYLLAGVFLIIVFGLVWNQMVFKRRITKL